MKATIRPLAVLALALGTALAAPAALAQVSVHFDTPGARIGVNLGGYPRLQAIPGYPVYYAPEVGANYFFYDGHYWVFSNDNWYASSWYNGPWALVDPFEVPDYVLRVPVRYYRSPPVYFRSWRGDAPPRWDERWGRRWSERHAGWERWDRRAVPPPAPLPSYQRDYRGDRYPDVSRQRTVHAEQYRYQPRDDWARRNYEAQRANPGSPPVPDTAARLGRDGRYIGRDGQEYEATGAPKQGRDYSGG